MIGRCLLVAVAGFAAQPGMAQEVVSSKTFADQLAGIMAAEKACSLAFNDARVQEFIEHNVAENDVNFSLHFSSAVGVMRYQVQAMSQVEQRAYCIQVRRSAGAYDLLEVTKPD